MIDPNEAPEGYRAEAREKEYACDGCAFSWNDDSCAQAVCASADRNDDEYVIFKRVKPIFLFGPVMAIYATPCDDMGAHV